MSSRRDEVLRVALELLDEVGLEDLTTRRLADRLGVRAGALYRHFESKRALLDAMVERIAAHGLDQPLPQGDWAEQVHALAATMREGMLAHRDGALLVATFRTPGPAAIAGFRRFMAVLQAAGASADGAVLGVDTILCYVNGFTIEEQARRIDVTARSAREERDRAFHAGLDLLLSGLRAALPQQPPPARAVPVRKKRQKQETIGEGPA
jgi:TetR/AcrR family tetracycline transcriptional repressor